MKKKLAKTKCTVKLRKSEYHNEWYLILESYPVFEDGKTKRIIEALNRSVTTPIWDKSRTARTTETSKTFKPKRDVNGIILCKSDADMMACVYADEIRKQRQREYDNADLFTDAEAAQDELNQKLKCDFIAYFKEVNLKIHAKSSEGIIGNWNRVGAVLEQYKEGKPWPFSEMTPKHIESFRQFVLTLPLGGKRTGTISTNTASNYFSIFKAALHQAFIDGYLMTDIAAATKTIPHEERRREHLTLEELNTLAATPCDNPIIRRAALFSALTGLRHCDIQKLTWSEIQKEDKGYRLNFTQKKTKGVEYMPISEQTIQLCGKRGKPKDLVFPGLPSPSWISKPLKRWIKAAGITRTITFHCFRHTYATLQLAGGTDIYTVSKMLGHTNVRTTQIYAKVVDEKKDKAANVITIDSLKLEEEQQ
ncbi:MAG: site-specific integrase [Bacteroidales bacterium]|nr:site-specific integrase [Bacteroidales bacterium]